MKLRWKFVVLFVLLLLPLFIIQGYLIDSLGEPFFLSSFLGLMIVIPLAYFFAAFFTRPVRRMTQMARRIAKGSLKGEGDFDPRDEYGELSKAIDEMGAELRNKIETISKEKDYLQTVLRGMKEGVLVVDGRGRILTVNDALRNLLSLSSTLTDKTPLEVIRNSELEGTIRRVIETGKSVTFELNLLSAGGKTFEVNVVAISPSPETADSHREGARGAITVFHDITRLKELEKVRQDFVANVSHELRTPLTTIKGYAETLLEGALHEEVAPQFIEIINRHTDRLTKIVDDLLMLSKVESKELHLKPGRLPVAELIGDVVDFVKGAAEKKGISILQGDIAASLAVEADRGYLEQVLINLLDNAIKYTSGGGRVTVSAIEKDQKEIQFSIEDNGIGIPKEDIRRIFERFYRVDKGRSKELGGTGLGLSIVKHIIQAHGGNVWAESQLGKGSIFYFTLPKYPVEKNPMVTGVPHPGGKGYTS
jgi:two-component system, OmpR family, phosphate regulon sensor histidine kinase PhoR